MSSASDLLIQDGLWCVDNAALIHYSMVNRTTWVGRAVKFLPITEDCSSFYTMLHKWAGLPDPNGLNYSPIGFTGTLLQHLEHITHTQCLPGDAVIYGPGTGLHVAMVYQLGPDFNMISHGEESDPSIVRDSFIHPGALRTYLRSPANIVVPNPVPPAPVPVPIPVPTPKAKEMEFIVSSSGTIEGDWYVKGSKKVHISQPELLALQHAGVQKVVWTDAELGAFNDTDWGDI